MKREKHKFTHVRKETEIERGVSIQNGARKTLCEWREGKMFL